MKNSLTRLEARLSGLIEGTFARIFAGSLQPREVVLCLAHAMDDYAEDQPDGSRLAPTLYIVHLNPNALSELRAAYPDFEIRLAEQLLTFARELDLLMPSTPLIDFQPNADLPNNTLQVSTPGASFEVSATQQFATGAIPLPGRNSGPVGYLILEGRHTVPLNQPVITLGRQLDNTIVIDNSRVSRHHAQLRQRFNRWLIFDLGSTGGTFLNGDQIDEAVLHSGDVILLSGEVRLIYIEDADLPPEGLPPEKEDTGHTRPLTNPPTLPGNH